MFLTIDPGREAGWALWNEEVLAPVDTGVIVPSKKLVWEEAIDLMVSTLRFRMLPAGKVYCEYPQYFQSFGGITSASEGSLVKLCIAYGRLNQAAIELGREFQGIEVNAWKGQMSKEAVVHRINKRLPGCSFKSHEWDAVGIGLHVKGIF